MVWTRALSLLRANCGRWSHYARLVAMRAWVEGDVTPEPRLGHLEPCSADEAWQALWHRVPDVVCDILFHDRVVGLWLRGGMPEHCVETGAVLAWPTGGRIVIHVMATARRGDSCVLR